jgi:hypothetical protein
MGSSLCICKTIRTKPIEGENMASSVTVEVIGGAEAQAKFYKLSAEQETKVVQQIVSSSLKIETDAKGRAPSDLGLLRSGILTTISQGGFVAEIKATKEYSGDIEYGTSPHFPPPSELAGWASRHGMAGLEYVIARAISKRGTKAQPFLIPSWTTEVPEFTTAMEKICKDLESGG